MWILMCIRMTYLDNNNWCIWLQCSSEHCSQWYFKPHHGKWISSSSPINNNLSNLVWLWTGSMYSLLLDLCKNLELHLFAVLTSITAGFTLWNSNIQGSNFVRQSLQHFYLTLADFAVSFKKKNFWWFGLAFLIKKKRSMESMLNNHKLKSELKIIIYCFTVTTD